MDTQVKQSAEHHQQAGPNRPKAMHGAHWRLFTRGDFEHSLATWQPQQAHSYFPGFSPPDGEQLSTQAHIHARQDAIRKAIGRVEEHVRQLRFEHGKEEATPRAKDWRTYRLNIGETLLAVVALKASEAYNLCEVDVFLTAEVAGVKALEATRAALLLLFSDAVKSGGSMAVQFTRDCAPTGLPEHVQYVARRAGVPLAQAHIKKGVLSPEEVRALYLQLSGLPGETQLRVRAMADQGQCSIERVCYLVAHGIWPAHGVMMLLSNSRHADLLLGKPPSVLNRHLYSVAMALGRAVVLSELLDQRLRYIAPERVDELTVFTRELRWNAPVIADMQYLAAVYGSLPATARFRGWSFASNAPVELTKQQKLVALLRPRPREEQRVFLRQDIEAAAKALHHHHGDSCLLVLASDSLQLPQAERADAQEYASRHGVRILACPVSTGALEAELHQRFRVGRTVRP